MLPGQSKQELAVAALLRNMKGPVEEVRTQWDGVEQATKLWLVVLDFGWAETVIASGCYERDAEGIAYALADALGCEAVIG